MRVIAGAYKGRRLKAPDWSGLRPTSDRLKETLFNVLGTHVAGARVLDGFAGAGALGIEALSRGAGSVTFVDQDRRPVVGFQDTAVTVDRGHAAETRRDPVRQDQGPLAWTDVLL